MNTEVTFLNALQTARLEGHIFDAPQIRDDYRTWQSLKELFSNRPVDTEVYLFIQSPTEERGQGQALHVPDFSAAWFGILHSRAVAPNGVYSYLYVSQQTHLAALAASRQ